MGTKLASENIAAHIIISYSATLAFALTEKTKTLHFVTSCKCRWMTPLDRPRDTDPPTEAQPLIMLFVTPVLFLLLHVRMSAVEKAISQIILLHWKNMRLA